MCGYITPKQKRLRDAAPALYEALKALSDEWEASFEGQETGFDDSPLHEVVIKARHALQQAEGREP